MICPTEPPARPEHRVLLINGDPAATYALSEDLRRVDPTLHLTPVRDLDYAFSEIVRGLLPLMILVELREPRSAALAFMRQVRDWRDGVQPLLIALTEDLACASVPPSSYGVDAILVRPVSFEDLSSLVLLARTSCSRDDDAVEEAPASYVTGAAGTIQPHH